MTGGSLNNIDVESISQEASRCVTAMMRALTFDSKEEEDAHSRKLFGDMFGQLYGAALD